MAGSSVAIMKRRGKSKGEEKQQLSTVPAIPSFPQCESNVYSRITAR